MTGCLQVLCDIKIVIKSNNNKIKAEKLVGGWLVEGILAI